MLFDFSLAMQFSRFSLNNCSAGQSLHLFYIKSIENEVLIAKQSIVLGMLGRLEGKSVIGGGKRIRTADFLRARQALYQLSYTPKCVKVGHPGLEPGTSPLSGVRSNHLS